MNHKLPLADCAITYSPPDPLSVDAGVLCEGIGACNCD